MFGVRCQVSGVRCHMSRDTCHVSLVRCQVSSVIFLDKVVELVGLGSVIKWA